MSQIANEQAAETDDQLMHPSEEPAEDPGTEEGGESAPDADGPIPLDQVFSILKNSRRRQVLEHLEEADGRASLGDVAEHIAARENDKDVRQITSHERKRAYVGLYQCHLPKMDAMGIISFDKDRGTIDLGEDVDVFFDYLQTSPASEAPPWHEYSVGLALFGALLLTTAAVARPLTSLPVVDVAVATIIVGFLLYSLASLDWGRLREIGSSSRDGV